MMIPTLTTERLILRAPMMGDFDALADFLAHDNSRWIGGPHNRDAAWRGFCGALGHWHLRGYGMWLVALKSDNTPVGRVGFINQMGWDEPELGWHVFPDFEGKGLAYEAALAARAHGPQFGIPAPISYVNADNKRSCALAERLGATVERTRAFYGEPTLVYRHPTTGAA